MRNKTIPDMREFERRYKHNDTNIRAISDSSSNQIKRSNNSDIYDITRACNNRYRRKRCIWTIAILSQHSHSVDKKIYITN